MFGLNPERMPSPGRDGPSPASSSRWHLYGFRIGSTASKSRLKREPRKTTSPPLHFSIEDDELRVQHEGGHICCILDGSYVSAFPRNAISVDGRLWRLQGLRFHGKLIDKPRRLPLISRQSALH
jgi:hypothetical protein